MIATEARVTTPVLNNTLHACASMWFCECRAVYAKENGTPMGQIWNRIKRIAQSYSRDSAWPYESMEDEDQQRLKEIIDELNRQDRAQHGQTRQGGQSSRQQHSQQRNAHEQQRGAPKPTGMTLETALRILGVPSTASNDDIKRAYKKLMMKYHPDRVASMSDVEQEAAKRRAQEVNGAYQYVKAAKGL